MEKENFNEKKNLEKENFNEKKNLFELRIRCSELLGILPARVRIPSPPFACSVGSEGFGVGGRRVVVGNESYWVGLLNSFSKADLERLETLRREVYFSNFNAKRRKGQEKCRNVYRVFSDSDLVKFFSVIPVKRVKFGVLLFSMLTTGFRIGEACNIRVSDIDFERGVISLFTEKAWGL